jgi:nanoRNase/pAp phosphatase (c-di-AMP/oligoRNAs hydrolase)
MRNVNGLFEVLRPDQSVCLVVHNNPDPDSLASALGLQYLLKKKGFHAIRIYYDGFIGRAENKAMLRQLKISTHLIAGVKPACRRQFVLLDCQPFAGNVTLPEKVIPLAVIDHHPLRQRTRKVAFFDVRPAYGACSTIIHEYLTAEDIPISTPVATALFHAIFSETQGLGREGSPADKKAYLELLPRVSFKRLSKIQYPSLSRDFISNLRQVLTGGFYYKHLVGVILEELPYPDFVAEMADFLLRIKNMTWSVCLGSHQGLLYISIRSKNIHANSARLIKRAIPKFGTAGGHELIAGARVGIDKMDNAEVLILKKDIVRKLLRELYHSDVDSLFNLVTNEPVPFSSA